MNTTTRFFILLALLVNAVAAWAQPENIQLTYKLSYKGFGVGETHESFVQTGSQYKLTSESKASGILRALFPDKINISSSGNVSKEGLRPTRFEQRRGKDASKTRTAAFNWDSNSLEMKYDGGDGATVELKPGSQDALSIIYQFMFAPLKEGTSKVFMTNGKQLEQYEFRKVEEISLDTPAGTFDTVHVARISAPGETRTDVWLAKDKNYIPVRVLVVEPSGDKIERLLTNLSLQ